MRVVAVLLSLAAVAVPAWDAIACPPGHYPFRNRDVQGCAPIPGYQADPVPRQPAAPLRDIVMTRGAVAIDPATERIGIAMRERDPRKARRLALERCGTRACKVEMEPVGECGALAWSPDGCALAQSPREDWARVRTP